MLTAEALLISGTGLPTAGIIQRLEDELHKPVVTGQTAALWQALCLVGVNARVLGYADVGPPIPIQAYKRLVVELGGVTVPPSVLGLR